jgi:hypothetical protein
VEQTSHQDLLKRGETLILLLRALNCGANVLLLDAMTKKRDENQVGGGATESRVSGAVIGCSGDQWLGSAPLERRSSTAARSCVATALDKDDGEEREVSSTEVDIADICCEEQRKWRRRFCRRRYDGELLVGWEEAERRREDSRCGVGRIWIVEGQGRAFGRGEATEEAGKAVPISRSSTLLSWVHIILFLPLLNSQSAEKTIAIRTPRF